MVHGISLYNNGSCELTIKRKPQDYFPDVLGDRRNWGTWWGSGGKCSRYWTSLFSQVSQINIVRYTYYVYIHEHYVVKNSFVFILAWSSIGNEACFFAVTICSSPTYFVVTTSYE